MKPKSSREVLTTANISQGASRSDGRTRYISFDRVAETFERTRPIPINVLERAYRSSLGELHLRGRITVLDAGVGTGRMIRPLMSRRLTLIGVDISLAMLSRLRDRYRAAQRRLEPHLVRADVTRLPIRDSTVQIVQSTHVLHLLSSWKDALLEWRRVVVTDGFLVIFWESGRKSRVRRVYERAVRRSLTRKEMRSSAVVNFMRNWGWSVRKWRIRWQHSATLITTLQILECRSFSRQWDLSDRDHAKAMTAANIYVKRQRARGIRRETLKRALEVTVATPPRAGSGSRAQSTNSHP